MDKCSAGHFGKKVFPGRVGIREITGVSLLHFRAGQHLLKNAYMRNLFIIAILVSISATGFTTVKPKQEPPAFAVIAYYSGGAELAGSIPVEKLTHIIFSFGHLKGNRLSIGNAKDSATIRKLVSLKRKNRSLKVILSLGGWGGCETCSPVFSTDMGRKEFASSVRKLLLYFRADGIDLDWEYPAIEGYPGHAYSPADRDNFTSLVRVLRDSLGAYREISFAAGGFDLFLQQSIDWINVMPLLDKVNLMSYDLVGGYSRITGHHTPLYSTADQKQSTDNAIRYLDSIGVAMNKVIIGAAFYARVWDSVASENNGLYQAGVFRQFIPYRNFPSTISRSRGYKFYRDTLAQAPYAYNVSRKLFATFDDSLSVAAKTRYALGKGLGGIMFWELSLDRKSKGLLDVIDRVKREND